MGLFGKLNRKNLYLVVISFFGTGLISKKIPGTVGSFFATLLVLAFPRSPAMLFMVSSALLIYGVYFCDRYIMKYGYDNDRDPGYVVIDEACGVFLGGAIICFFGFSSISSILVNFVLFRIFDIVKPIPIRTIERVLKKNDRTVGLGIMLDDVLAAVFASVVQILICKYIVNL